MVVTEPGCDHTISGQMWSQHCDDESSSSSSDQQKYNSNMGRKRQATSSFEDNDKQTKKVKNREAARRCREKKQRQTEELRKKNQELEKDNCSLAKQKDELIKICRKYQQEIEQHKDQGCKVPHFDPPYNIDNLLNPPSPPSPCLSLSTHSESTSPSPSVSPGPQGRQAAYRSDFKPAATHYHETELLQAGTTDATPTSAATASNSQMHDLLVRKQDGSISKLRLTHENYMKVMQRLKALKEKEKEQQLQQQQESEQEQQKRQLQPPSAMLTATSQPQKQMPFLPQLPHDPPVRTDLTLSLVETQESQPSGGSQKLNTTDYNDLISVLQNNVKEIGNFDLMPVNPNEVLSNEEDLLVKQEPTDSGYNLGFEEVEIKPDTEADTPPGQWSSTGEHIRAGMDTLTHQEHPNPSSQNIQSIVHFLEEEDQNDMGTVTVTGPKTSNMVEKPMTRSVPLKAARRSDDTRKMATASSSPSSQRVMYITSSAPMGTLGSKIPGTSLNTEGAQSGPSVTVSTMPNIKIRPSVTTKLPVIPPNTLGVTSQMAPANSSQNARGGNRGTVSHANTSSGIIFLDAQESEQSQAITSAPLQLEQRVSADSLPQTENNVLIVSSPNASGTASDNLVSSFTFCLNNYSIEAMASSMQ